MERKILIAEDNFMIGKFMELTLKRNGYDVHLCSNSDEAINEVQEHRYDLMITELAFSTEEGIDLIKNVHTQNTTLPIIALTRNETDSKLKEAIDEGIYDYILKPVNGTNLLFRLNRILR